MAIKRSKSGELMAGLGSFSKKERNSDKMRRSELQRKKKRDPAAPFRE